MILRNRTAAHTPVYDVASSNREFNNHAPALVKITQVQVHILHAFLYFILLITKIVILCYLLQYRQTKLYRYTKVKRLSHNTKYCLFWLKGDFRYREPYLPAYISAYIWIFAIIFLFCEGILLIAYAYFLFKQKIQIKLVMKILL